MNGMEKEIIEVSLDNIIPNRFQPRLAFDEKGLNELAESIRQHGIIQPLVLRKVADKYEIIAGERRYKAAYIAGLNKVPAVIIDLNDNESAEVAIVENIQRRDLSPIEEAKSYKKLLDRGYLTQDQLASRMGKTQATISNKLRLLNLDDTVQDALLNNKISERHARSLLRLSDKEKQKEVLDLIITNKMNVRDTEKLIAEKLGKPKENYVMVSSVSNVSNMPKDEEPIEFPKFIKDSNTSSPIPMSDDAIDSFFDNKNNNKENIEKISDISIPITNEINLSNISKSNDPLDVEVIDEDEYNFNININNATDKIKNVVAEIQQMGFDVKFEEYDFAELNQFVIKVKKSNKKEEV